MSPSDSPASNKDHSSVSGGSTVHKPSGGGSTVHKKRRDGTRSTRKQSAAPTFYVSGFWRRLLAAGIDLALILPVALLLCKIAGAITGLSLPPSRIRGVDFWLDLFLNNDGTLIGALGLTLAIAWIYSFTFHISMGRTLGMRALKLRIIDVYGDQPSTQRAALRTTGYLFGVLTLGLGFIWIAFDSEKRGVHDWLAGTYVVKTKT